MDEKKLNDAFTHPDPGRNMKRQFINATMESNKSPVDFVKYSDRKPFFEQFPKWGGKEGPCDSRFEPFDPMPAINSKYSTKDVNQVAKFVNQIPRINE
jgi:hypothetical protein